MNDSRWNSSLFVGSGHAQSMLLHGQPLLGTTPTVGPVQFGDTYRSDEFKGSVTLWMHRDPPLRWEVRWQHSGRAARVPLPAILRVVTVLGEEAGDLEIKRVEREWAGSEEEFDQAIEAGAIPELTEERILDYVTLVRTYGLTLAGSGWKQSVGELGVWTTEVVEDVPQLVWRAAGERRLRRMPFSVMLWAAAEVPEIIDGIVAAHRSASARSPGGTVTS